MADFNLQMDDTTYRLVGPDGEESPIVDYDEVAALSIDGAVYYAHVTEPDAETQYVCCVKSVTKMAADTEDVTFDESAGATTIEVQPGN